MRYSDEITEYIYKQMSPLQKEAFEQRLENDPALAAEVREQQRMLEAIRGARLYEEAINDPHREEAERIAKEILEAQEKEKRSKKKENPAEKKKVRRFSIKRFPAAAAAFAVFLVDQYLGRMLSDSGMGKGARKRLGINENVTRRLGVRLGRRLARLRSRFRKR